MRERINRKSAYFVKHTGWGNVELDELRAVFESNTDESKRLLNSVVKYADDLVGTRAYWTGQGHQLAAYVYNLGALALFMTFSPADLHWDSLAKAMRSGSRRRNRSGSALHGRTCGIILALLPGTFTGGLLCSGTSF